MTISAAFNEVLGTGISFWFLVATLLGATLLAPSGSILRRYAALVLSALALTRIHPPFTQNLVESTLPTFQPWRLVFWPMPMVALAAGGILSLLFLAQSGRGRRISLGLVLSILLLAATFGPTATLRPENQIRITGPGLKVPANDFDLASEISRRTPGRAIVLAPDAIATWLPVSRNHDYPYLVRLVWANRLGPRLGWREAKQRWKLMRYVGGWEYHSNAPTELARRLREGKIDVVVFHRGMEWTNQVREIIRAAGGSRLLMNDRYEVWSEFRKP